MNFKSREKFDNLIIKKFEHSCFNFETNISIW